MEKQVDEGIQKEKENLERLFPGQWQKAYEEMEKSGKSASIEMKNQLTKEKQEFDSFLEKQRQDLLSNDVAVILDTYKSQNKSEIAQQIVSEIEQHLQGAQEKQDKTEYVMGNLI